MKLKSFFFAAALTALTLSIASAKTYDVSFSSPTKAGSVQLKPGEYQLKIDGNKATFVDVKTNKAFTTDVKVENVTKSFETTRVDSTTVDKTEVVKDIQLGGSKTQVDF